MRRCSVKPYEGQEAYIFISYCHKDRASVFPIIEQMARDGYRVWYDEGIDPGSEWPERSPSFTPVALQRLCPDVWPDTNKIFLLIASPPYD